MNYKKLLIGSLAFAVIAFGGAAIARADNDHDRDIRNSEREAKVVGSTLEVHITDGGKVLVRGAKVSAISGATVTATTTWGSASMNWNVTTDSSTKYIRRYGGASSLAEIAVGDFISFEGTLTSASSSTMTLTARTVKDWSIQKKNATFDGTVSSVSGTSFVIATKKSGNITVNTSSATQIMKNGSTGAFADITVGRTVMATGIYNNLTNVLESSKVVVKIEQPKPLTKEGTLKSIAGTTAPTTFVLTIDGTDYTVRVASNTSVLTNNWLNASLSNFAAGNKVRVYGVVNTDNTIDATVVRNTNL